MKLARSRTNLITRFSNQPTYDEVVASVWGDGLIQYTRLNETSGSTVIDSSDEGNNGSYNAGALVAADFSAMGQPAPLLDGDADANINQYSVALNADFNGQEGSVVLWFKMTDLANWSDGTRHEFFRISVNSSNSIYSRSQTASNTLNFSYIAGGVTKSYDYAVSSPADHVCIGVTWSNANDYVRFYFNGVRVQELTGLGTWVGNLSTIQVVIGAGTTGGVNSAEIIPSEWQLGTTLLSDAQHATLATPIGSSPRGDLYVSAAIGDDTTGDGTSDNPYATIGKANEIAADEYDTRYIYVAAGTYQELVSTPRQYVSYVAQGAVIIDGQDVRDGFNILHLGCEVRGFEIINCVIGVEIANTQSITVRDCEVQSCTSYGLRAYSSNDLIVRGTTSHTNGDSGFSFQSCDTLTVYDCEAYGQTIGASAFYAQNTTGILWYNNYAHDNTDIYGFEIEEGSDNATIRDCWSETNSIGFICKTSDATLFLRNVAWGNASYGIYFKGGQNGFVYHCDAYDNADGIAVLQDDITLDFSTGNTIKNCIISGNSGYALRLDAGSQTGFVSDYNDFNTNGNVGNWGGVNQATLAAWQSASSQDANSLTDNPSYVSTVYEGFALPAESSLREAGTDVGYGISLGHG